MMGTKIEIVHPDGVQTLEGLRIFLTRDPAARKVGRIRWETSGPGEEELGDGLDVLSIVISSVLGLPDFVQAVANWVRSRNGATDAIEIKLGAAQITVTGTDDPGEINRLADVLKAAYPAPSVDGYGGP